MATLKKGGALLTAQDKEDFRAGIGIDTRQNMFRLRSQILARRPVSWDVMQSPPSITLGAANAASSISGFQNIAHNSSLIFESTRCITGTVFPDTLLRVPRNIDGQASGTSAAFTSGLCASWSIITNAQQVEFRIKGLGFVSRGRVWVTENGTRKLAGVVPATSPDGSLYWVLIGFGNSSFREIEIELSGGGFGGFNVSSGAVFGRKEQNGPSILIAGDSFTEGSLSDPLPSNLYGYHDGWAPRFLRMLGVDKKHVSALGATGYTANNGGARKSLSERYPNDIITLAPDIVIHANGINDSAIGLESAATSIFNGIQNALPNCIQIAFGPFRPRSIDVEARRAAIAAACASTGVIFIDNVTDNEITGTGRIGAPAVDGNSDIVIGPDTTHPTAYGHQYIAEWRFRALCKAIGI